ncbi:MAG: glycosyl transferase family 1 [Brevundimonas subvibrioides]|uniref:Glycosyl transferase family 1 n=1 Tax=Brevundimonas subvibrioides TaxID=74313 RepID=A0A258HDT1_9CAUL|nr:glycosyltransferase family 1 protein [Brevundimonas subvibrioides]OYX55036.1 MAG: glycosyl transferase family 1 [Brevundimonas subvibrioides]
MTRSVLFDASRLLSRVERTAPTGVDRVCLAYAEWLLSLPDVQVTPVRGRNDQLVVVDEAWFRECVATLRSRWTGAFFERSLTEDEMRLMTALSSDTKAADSVIGKPPTDPARPPGRRRRVWKQFFRSQWIQKLPDSTLYFNVGHTGLGDDRILGELRDRGIERIVFLHDLIPITHPEFCRPGDRDKHRQRVLNTLNTASRIVVNSRYTADELAAFAAREGVTPPPIHAVHLGLEPTFLTPLTAATPRPYFVHIGTIEARKNLAFLLSIWRRLYERMGDAAPQLVLVGRYGWENEAVLDHLERSPALRGLVHQASDLPDSALATLMASARALVAPSSVEGFDLPAVEASALGVALIASDIPVHRELVPDAQLIDPLDGLGWLDALETATRHPPKATPFSAPTWERHFAEVARRVGLSQ